MANIYENMFVERVIDGDTIEVYGSTEPEHFARKKVRLYEINTPEIRGASRPEGLAAKEFVKNLIEGRTVTLKVYGRDDFGRWIADVYIGVIDIIIKGEELNDKLVDEHYAEEVKR